ncbi:hypothetical protein [Staphylococcus felis]|uniref:hypothetical protein n=1 Tax=Staphylococcus felis TaxID=46127 RepID=UPI0039673350
MSVLTEKERKELSRKKEIARANARLNAKKRGVKVRGSIYERWEADDSIAKELASKKK